MDNYIKILETWSGELEDLCYELYSMLMKENAGGITGQYDAHLSAND